MKLSIDIESIRFKESAITILPSKQNLYFTYFLPSPPFIDRSFRTETFSATSSSLINIPTGFCSYQFTCSIIELEKIFKSPVMLHLCTRDVRATKGFKNKTVPGLLAYSEIDLSLLFSPNSIIQDGVNMIDMNLSLFSTEWKNNTINSIVGWVQAVVILENFNKRIDYKNVNTELNTTGWSLQQKQEWERRSDELAALENELVATISDLENHRGLLELSRERLRIEDEEKKQEMERYFQQKILDIKLENDEKVSIIENLKGIINDLRKQQQSLSTRISAAEKEDLKLQSKLIESAQKSFDSPIIQLRHRLEEINREISDTTQAISNSINRETMLNSSLLETRAEIAAERAFMTEEQMRQQRSEEKRQAVSLTIQEKQLSISEQGEIDKIQSQINDLLKNTRSD